MLDDIPFDEDLELENGIDPSDVELRKINDKLQRIAKSEGRTWDPARDAVLSVDFDGLEPRKPGTVDLMEMEFPELDLAQMADRFGMSIEQLKSKVREYAVKAAERLGFGDVNSEDFLPGRRMAVLMPALLVLLWVGIAKAEEDREGEVRSGTDGHLDGHKSEHGEAGSHAELNKYLDLGTAGAVVASFIRHVIVNGAVKGIALGPKSAAEVGGLAFARIAALKAFGGEAGNHRAAEDLAEIKGGLMPLPLLVALSDATNESLRVDEKKIFEDVTGALEPNLDYSNVRRPGLGAEVVEWQSHLDNANKDLVSKVAQISAVTSVLAPIGTTYTSSSLANTMKEDILRMLYEQSYAMEVIKQKSSENGSEASGVLHHDEVHKAAVERADTFFSGRIGFSKLMFALAANTQGSWGVGDPPEIYFAINYAHDPITMAMAHSVGAINSELYTILLNMWWLKAIGAGGQGQLFKELINGQLKTAKAVVSTLKPDEFTVSYRQGKGFKDALIKALESDGESLNLELAKILAKIPAAKLQFSPAEYLRKKIDALNVVGSQKLSQIFGGSERPIDQGALHDQDEFATGHVFHELEKLAGEFFDSDPERVKARLSEIEKQMQGAKAERLTELFESVMVTRIASSNEEEAPDPVDVESGVANKGREAMSVASRISKELLGLDEASREDRLSSAMEILGADLEDKGGRLYDVFNQADEETIQAALAKLTAIGGVEDVVPGLEHGAQPGESVAGAVEHTPHDHGAHVLTHSAREVLWALLTQIPSVPSIAHFAQVMIPKLAGVKDGEKPSPEQLKKIVLAMLPIEGGMSGIADNVAAYLFAELVLRSFFKDTFGEDLFEKTPQIEREIGIISKMIAEQAGSLTQVGNGPNFSQEAMLIQADSSNAQGIGINRVSQEMGDTLPHKNFFSSAANATLILGAVGYLWKRIDDLAAPPEEALRMKSRRDLFRTLSSRDESITG